MRGTSTIEPAGHSVVCPVLVGRGAPLSALRHVLERARTGTGGTLLLSGEAGIGKSRLLRAGIDDARAMGFIVLQGACFEADRTLPYAPLLDLVHGLVATSSSTLAAHYLAPATPELIALFPELGSVFTDVAPRTPIDPEQDRRRLFHAVAQAIIDLARVQPVLLVFEDVHWSDDPSLELVLHLARSTAPHGAVLALTYRSDEVGPRLARLLAELDRTRLAAELPLAGLSLADVTAMLEVILGSQSGLPDTFAGGLHALTEGNAFFVEEILKALMVAGDLSPIASGGWRARPLDRVRVPRTAVEAVRRRLAGLSVPARDVASVAAVAGRRFDFALLQMLTIHDERALLALVKELVSAQLVEEESADRFAFRHALTREAIRAELLARERVALHRDVAAALERMHQGALDATVEALAYHTFEAGDWARARAYATRAATHALALFAPHEALAHLERAYAAGTSAGIAPDVALLLARGGVHETLGDFQRAHEDFTRALEAARTARVPNDEWQALHALGLLWAARDYERAGRYRREALDVARTTGDQSLVARSLNRVGNWHVNVEEPRAALPFHEEALAIFERLADRRGVAETLDLVAMAHHIAGAQPEAAAFWERSVALFTEREDRRGLANALGLLALCGPSYHCSCTTVCVSAISVDVLANERAVRVARDIGWRAGESFCLFILADCLAWRGSYDRALRAARQSLALAEEIEHLQWQCGARRLLGSIALDLNAPSVALSQLEPAYAIAQRLGSATWLRWTAATLAIAAARAGDIGRATAVLEQVARAVPAARTADGADEDPTPTLGERHLWLARAELALARGDAAEALDVADMRLASERSTASRPRDSAHHATPGVPRLTLIRGRALTALGRHEEAAVALDAAREEARSQDARSILWRVEAAVGHAHLACRRRLQARRAFDAARAVAEELEALVGEEELRQTFRAGVDAIAPPPPPPTRRQSARAAHAGLTRREREVAQLVAEGRANRAIGRALGIGERTVESYVAGALAKLGFTSRAQLAAWAVEQRLARGTSNGR